MRNLNEIMADAFLSLPIADKTYVVKPLGYKDELRIKEATEATQTAIADGSIGDGQPLSDEEFLRLVLGDVLDDMRTNNVPPAMITRAGMTAHVYNTHGPLVAEQMWENGPSPEALAASLKAATQRLQDSQPSKITAVASETRSRASSTGTSTRQGTRRPAAKATAKPSRAAGRKSSTSGA